MGSPPQVPEESFMDPMADQSKEAVIVLTAVRVFGIFMLVSIVASLVAIVLWCKLKCFGWGLKDETPQHVEEGASTGKRKCFWWATGRDDPRQLEGAHRVEEGASEYELSTTTTAV
ncbi:MAG: hypothetical protein M1833_004752 [Piccolia ochrophora]|nr:MAG: hypothetical protein M1833_004752 [Piccolia ochrophora]